MPLIPDWWYTESIGNIYTTTSTTSAYIGGNTANSTYSNTIWTQWTDTNTTSTQDTMWRLWVQSQRGYQSYQGYNQEPPPPRVRTAAEIAEEDARIAAEEARMDAYRQQESRRRKQLEEATARAEELLLKHLSPEQVDDYKRKKSFTVCSRSGSRYRVRCAGISGNIDLLGPKDGVVARFCAHAPYDSMVGADHYLAQMLNLTHNEEEFLRVANRH